MGRARGANAQLALGYNATTTYGGVPSSGNYLKLPFVSIDLGEEQGLVQSDLIGYGRDPQTPGRDVVNDTGNVVVPVDARAFGYWLKMLFGAAASDTQGAAASGSFTFSANPTNAQTIVVNGTTWTFKTSPAAATEVQIGSTLADTIRNLVVALNKSADANTAAASYLTDIAKSQILVTSTSIGTGGNTFTLGAGTSGAAVSGATLAGGVATGNYNHTFVAGALTLPDAGLEIGLPDVPSYAMNYGVVANTVAINLSRSGNLTASIALIAQGEQPRSGSSAAGSLTEIVLERFSQFQGQIYRDGAALAEITSASLNFSNGLDTVEAIRSDGRISGVDPGMMAATLDLTARFADTVILALAQAGTPVEIRFQWKTPGGRSLTFIFHNVYLPTPKVTVPGPAGIQVTYQGQASEHPTLHKTLTAVLVNDIAAH